MQNLLFSGLLGSQTPKATPYGAWYIYVLEYVEFQFHSPPPSPSITSRMTLLGNTPVALTHDENKASIATSLLHFASANLSLTSPLSTNSSARSAPTILSPPLMRSNAESTMNPPSLAQRTQSSKSLDASNVEGSPTTTSPRFARVNATFRRRASPTNPTR